MTIHRLNTGHTNQSALVGYFKACDNNRMVKWLSGCLLRFDTVLWRGENEKFILELYVNDVPEPDFDREPTREEADLIEAFKELCDPPEYLGFYLFQLDGRLWRNPVQTLSRPRIETSALPALPADPRHEVGLNNCFFRSERVIKHDELSFRSPPEISIYDELNKRCLLLYFLGKPNGSTNDGRNR